MADNSYVRLEVSYPASNAGEQLPLCEIIHAISMLSGVHSGYFLCGDMIPDQEGEFYERSPLIESASSPLQRQALFGPLRMRIEHQRFLWERGTSFLRCMWKNNLQRLLYAWPLVWPAKEEGLQHRPLLCAGIFLLQRVLYGLVPYLFGRLVEDLHSLEGQTLDPAIFVVLAGYLLSKFIKDYLCKSLQSLIWLKVALRSQKVIAMRALNKMFDRPEDHDKWASGAVLSDFNKGGSLNTCLEEVLFSWIPILCDLITTTIFIWVVLGKTFGFLTSGINSWYIYCAIRNSRRSIRLGRGEIETKRAKDGVVKPILDSVLDIVLQNGVKTEISCFEEAQNEYHDRKYQTTSTLTRQDICPNAFFQLGIYLIAVFTILQIGHGQRKGHDLIAFLTYMEQLHVSLNSFGSSLKKFLSGVINTERLSSIEIEKVAICNIAGARDMAQCAVDVEFVSICLSSSEPLNFLCRRGQTTIIKGVPSSERPTLTHYLARVAEAQEGIIKIDGLNIRDYTTNSLRRNVGVISRESNLLGGTIIQCLKYGLRNPEVVEEETVSAVCAAVNIQDGILGAGGYDAPVCKNGYRLTSEQMRRITLARLLLQDSRILVFDGALAKIHGETEEHLGEVVKNAFCGRTVLVIDDEVPPSLQAGSCIYNTTKVSNELCEWI